MKKHAKVFFALAFCLPLMLILFSCKKDPVPVASFTFSPESAKVDEPVSFSNTSEYALAYKWSFGDGGGSELKDPDYSYLSAGTFTITLTATGDGGTASLSRNITVTYPAPQAEFTVDRMDPKVGETVTFTNKSKYGNGYLWDFGDGETSTSVSPTHVFTKNGSFIVKLTVSGESGSGTATLTLNVTYPAPVASFSIDKMTAKAGEVITFTNTSQNATSYSWNFGNGKTSTLTNPTHSYSSAGNYTITLTATGNGGENSTSKTVEITAPALVGKWILAEGSFNTVMIASLTGYFKIVDAVKYEAQFSNGTYSGDVVANYTIAGTTFKSALNGQSFLLNGTTSSYTCCPMSVIWRTTMICSSTVFNQWGKTAIGYGEPKIEIIGSQLVITSSDGKTILKYNKE